LLLLVLVLQVPCFVRDALVDVPGHKHRYHHLGMVQSLPPGVLAAAVARASRAGLASATMLLHNAPNATAAAAAGAVGDDAGSDSGLLLPRSSVKGVQPGSMPFLHIGVPVVFHRTSFNSKFFPDCLDKKKIADKYCQVIKVLVTSFKITVVAAAAATGPLAATNVEAAASTAR
jgi:hypothetical protein